MSAAREACIEGITSIGFSLDTLPHTADMGPSKYYAEKIMRSVLDSGLTANKLLNVNIPALPKDEIKGIKVCKQGTGSWRAKFKVNEAPRGREYYWLDGDFVADVEDKESDLWALKNGYVSVVPSLYDLTHYEAIEDLKYLEA